MTEVDTKKLKKVIERVQLLFNRADHAVEDSDNTDEVDHEAQSALELARKLMLQYGLEMEDVETANAGKSDGVAGGVTIDLGTKQTAKWALSLAVVVADYMDAQVLYLEPTYWQGGRLTYYGVKLNANMAAYGFRSVFNQIKQLSRKYKVDRNLWTRDPFARFNYKTFDMYRNAAKREYREGLVWGFAKRLKELKEVEQASAAGEQITALAVQYESIAKSWLEDQKIETRERKSRKGATYTGGGHYVAGEKDSKEVEIRKGLGDAAES